MATGEKPRILVFASGSATGGGSGFRELVEFAGTKIPVLDARIVGVVSNHENGGVRRFADELSIPFTYWNGPFDAQGYRRLVAEYEADFVMLSGWLKIAVGLDPRTTVNIHPGPLPLFGGKGMYGHHVHDAVIRAYREDRNIESAVTMHFVDPEFDRGPVLFRFPIPVREDDTPETLAARVNEKERSWQAAVLNEVVHGRIRLSEDLKTVIYDHPRVPIFRIGT
ncbi:MAG: phosphoribosylglycinamide formyltransferase [Candidatus Moranbacteria bacterium]|nr:phosphoribosylglycinamide formyltransferase [Candidatus Moranbacteria bacterium]